VQRARWRLRTSWKVSFLRLILKTTSSHDWSNYTEPLQIGIGGEYQGLRGGGKLLNFLPSVSFCDYEEITFLFAKTFRRFFTLRSFILCNLIFFRWMYYRLHNSAASAKIYNFCACYDPVLFICLKGAFGKCVSTLSTLSPKTATVAVFCDSRRFRWQIVAEIGDYKSPVWTGYK